MPSLHVALHPDEHAPADVAIVVDAIRATTTIAHALAGGYERVLCTASPDEARELARSLGDTAILGGELAGAPLAGFDLGNSPAEYDVPRAAAVVFATTNGTRAILRAAAECPIVLCGSLPVLGAVAAAAAARAGGGSVAVRCAGRRGGFAVEDAYVAGRLVALLAPGRETTDAARVALAVVHAHADPAPLFAASASGRHVTRLGNGADLMQCTAVDTLGVAPLVVPGAGAAAEVRVAQPVTPASR